MEKLLTFVGIRSRQPLGFCIMMLFFPLFLPILPCVLWHSFATFHVTFRGEHFVRGPKFWIWGPFAQALRRCGSLVLVLGALYVNELPILCWLSTQLWDWRLGNYTRRWVTVRWLLFSWQIQIIHCPGNLSWQSQTILFFKGCGGFTYSCFCVWFTTTWFH